MTCDEAIRAIEAMIDRELEDDERMTLEAHLAACESCRRDVDERRAFSDRVGRDLNEAFPFAPPGARRVVIRPRRLPWVRAAAVVLAGIAIGYTGSASGLFRPASAEAREVAGLSALKAAYEDRDRELEGRLERETAALDRRASRAPEGAVRDAVALCVMHAATGFAPARPLVLPAEPAERVRLVARQMSSPDWSRRGLAVRALRQLSAADAVQMESQIVNLDGTSRTLAELWLRSVNAPSMPAVTVEFEGGAGRFVQLQNAQVRFEVAGLPTKEGINILEFRAKNPELSAKLGLKGIDGNFMVAGVRQISPTIETRPAVYVPALIWSPSASDPGAVIDALSAHAVMVDGARAGWSIEEIERRGARAMRAVQEISSRDRFVVHGDPRIARRRLSEFRGFDAVRLTLARERLQDELAALERRVLDLGRRLDCVRKAAVTLEYAER